MSGDFCAAAGVRAELRRLRHVLQEYPCAVGPGHAKREVAAVLARAFQRAEAGAAQILIEHANRRFPDDVARRRGGNAATGTPLASASSSTRPNVSVRLGNTKTSAAA